MSTDYVEQAITEKIKEFSFPFLMAGSRPVPKKVYLEESTIEGSPKINFLSIGLKLTSRRGIITKLKVTHKVNMTA
jgi:hypothetical protein